MSHLSDTASSAVVAGEEDPQDEVVLHKVGDLRGHESRLFSAQFSPKDEGLLATCSEDATCRSVKVWDITQGRQKLLLREHTEAIYSVSWSPDGNFLLTGASDGKIILWDAHTGSRKTVLSPGGDVFGVAFFGEGRIVSASEDTVTLWDVQTGMMLQSRAAKPATEYVFGGRSRNPDATPWVFCLNASHEYGVVALGVSDATVRVWDSSLQERVVFRGHAKDVCSLTLKDDATELLSGSGDAMAGVWDMRVLKARMVLKGHSGSVHDSCYLPDSRGLCTVSNDKTLRIWDPEDGSPLGCIGPDITAKLCCAPNTGLAGIAVGGGENKSLFGGDFRVSLYSYSPDGLETFKEARNREAVERAHTVCSDATMRGAEESQGRDTVGEGAGGGGEPVAQGLEKKSAGDASEGECSSISGRWPELSQTCRLSEEDIEDLSLKDRLDLSKRLREAAGTETGEAARKDLLDAAQRLLFDVDEDSPKHAQWELAALLELKNSLGL